MGSEMCIRDSPNNCCFFSITMKTHYLKSLSGIALLISPLLFSSCSSPVATSPAYSPAVEAASPSNRGQSYLKVAQDSTNSSIPKPTRPGLGSVSRHAPEPARPGLGTGWGNQITSNINYGSFTRSSAKPKTTAAIYYNDKEGVEAVSYTHLRAHETDS